MTESPFVKAEGPEPPDVGAILREKHWETMAQLDAAILDQLVKQPFLRIPENMSPPFVEDARYEYAYPQGQMQPGRKEIDEVRAAAYRTEMELSRLRTRLAEATDELYRVMNSLRQAESKLLDNYQLICQLVGYLDSIEWGTHEEWTRSQSLRERVHEYVESFTVSFNTITT